MKKFIKPSVAIALGLFASQSATAAELAIEQGTMSAGGQATLGMYMAGGSTIIDVTVAPGFGYFVSDNIEVFGNINFNLVAVGGDSGTSLGLGVGANYYVDAGSMKVYFGIHTDMALTPEVDIGAGAQAGLLLGLSDSVALDIGIRPTYYIQSEVFALNAGAVGIRAFF